MSEPMRTPYLWNTFRKWKVLRGFISLSYSMRYSFNSKRPTNNLSIARSDQSFRWQDMSAALATANITIQHLFLSQTRAVCFLR